MEKDPYRGRRFCWWLAVFFWMGLIFWFSSQNAVDSAQSSSSTLTFLMRLFRRSDALLTETDPLYLTLEFLLRKSAHFFVFGVLGGLLYMTILQYPDSDRTQQIAIPVSVGIVYASIDELHQFFVPGRACQIRDVCIDTVGICCGVLLCLFIRHLWRLRKQNKMIQTKERQD